MSNPAGPLGYHPKGAAIGLKGEHRKPKTGTGNVPFTQAGGPKAPAPPVVPSAVHSAAPPASAPTPFGSGGKFSSGL